MNKIKGLTSGLFCDGICGDYKYRNKVYNTYYKEYVEQGLFIRSIESAPRDSRYKIDWYFKEGVNHSTETLDYEHIGYHTQTLNFLGIDESFSPFELKKYKNHKCNNEFELCYGDVEYYDTFWKKPQKIEQYYFKYKGKANKIRFKYGNGIVYEDNVVSYDNFERIFYEISYFIKYFIDVH